MERWVLLAWVAFAAAGVLYGLRVRHGSFLAALTVQRAASDAEASGWVASAVLKHPTLCRLLEAAHEILPCPRTEDMTDAVSRTTTFSYLQTRTILLQYFRWQVHNLLRVLLALVFFGVLVACATTGINQQTYTVVAITSAGLATYALCNWWKIRENSAATRKVCSAGGDAGSFILDSFSELSRGALRQAIAFTLIFSLNLGFQVVSLFSPDAVLPSGEQVTVQELESDLLGRTATFFAG